jgi:hypothetical protein
MIDQLHSGAWAPVYEKERAFIKCKKTGRKIPITDTQYKRLFQWYFFRCSAGDILHFQVLGIHYQMQVTAREYMNIKLWGGSFICCDRCEFWHPIARAPQMGRVKLYPFMIKKC